MTTRKITTFLMCPASTPSTAGGTPQLDGDAGGHIKKSAWVHVFDAASVALLDTLALREEYDRRRTQHRVERQEDEAGTSHSHHDLGAHASLDAEPSRVDERDEAQLGGGEGAGHGDASGLRFKCGERPRDGAVRGFLKPKEFLAQRSSWLTTGPALQVAQSRLAAAAKCGDLRQAQTARLKLGNEG